MHWTPPTPPTTSSIPSPRRVSLNLCLDWRESWTSPFFSTPHFCTGLELWKDFLTEPIKQIFRPISKNNVSWFPIFHARSSFFVHKIFDTRSCIPISPIIFLKASQLILWFSFWTITFAEPMLFPYWGLVVSRGPRWTDPYFCRIGMRLLRPLWRPLSWLCPASKGRGCAGERRMMSAATVFISTFYAFGVSRGCTIRAATAGKRRKHCLDVSHEILKTQFFHQKRGFKGKRNSVQSYLFLRFQN